MCSPRQGERKRINPAFLSTRGGERKGRGLSITLCSGEARGRGRPEEREIPATEGRTGNYRILAKRGAALPILGAVSPAGSSEGKKRGGKRRERGSFVGGSTPFEREGRRPTPGSVAGQIGGERGRKAQAPPGDATAPCTAQEEKKGKKGKMGAPAATGGGFFHERHGDGERPAACFSAPVLHREKGEKRSRLVFFVDPQKKKTLSGGED